METQEEVREYIAQVHGRKEGVFSSTEGEPTRFRDNFNRWEIIMKMPELER